MVFRLPVMIVIAALWSGVRGFCGDDQAYAALDAAGVLVRVNEQPITKGDLEFELMWRRVPHDQQPSMRRQFVDELIERRLLGGFLEQRRVAVPEELIDRQLQQLRQLTQAAGSDFDEVIFRLGFSEESLRKHLELPLAWRIHLNRTITDGQLAEYFEGRRAQLDGTRIRASQIVISVPDDAGDEAWRSADQTLTRVRQEIASGEVEFAEAARRHSTSPSREHGGDLGFFAFEGQVPAAVAAAAFELETGKLSQPIRSPFGMHLLMTTDRVPGQLSLEDVRGQVFRQLSQQMWDEEAQRQRADAEIEWLIDLQRSQTTESDP